MRGEGKKSLSDQRKETEQENGALCCPSIDDGARKQREQEVGSGVGCIENVQGILPYVLGLFEMLLQGSSNCRRNVITKERGV